MDAASEAARNNELDRLRRIAFGRTATDSEERAAEEALAEIARIEAAQAQARDDALAAARDAELTAARDAERAREAEHDASEISPDVAATDETDASRPSAWRRLAAPVGVGLLVGAVVAGGAVWAYRPAATEPASAGSSSPSAPSPTASASGSPTGVVAAGGDVQAAEQWFADKQTDEDLVGVGSLLPEYDRDSVRLVHASAIARAWVAKRTDGQLCLEVTLTDDSYYTSGSCALPPAFIERGLTVSDDAITVHWNGSQVNVLLARP